LAERLLARRQFIPHDGLPEFNVETNKATYLLANGKIAGPSRDRDGLGPLVKSGRAERVRSEPRARSPQHVRGGEASW